MRPIRSRDICSGLARPIFSTTHSAREAMSASDSAPNMARFCSPMPHMVSSSAGVVGRSTEFVKSAVPEQCVRGNAHLFGFL